MKTRFIFFFFLGISSLAAVATLAAQAQQVPSEQNQTTISTNSKGSSTQPQAAEVFIAFDDPAAQDTNLKGIGVFATDLVRLRLLSSMSSVTIYKGGKDQSCGYQETRQSLQYNENSQATPTAGSNTKKGANREKVRYYITGNIQLTERSSLGSPKMVVHYLVKKCTGTKEFLLIPPQDLSFPTHQMVDELNWIGSNISHQIQSEIPRESVSVHDCLVADNSPMDDSLKPFASQIKSRIMEKLNASRDFQIGGDTTEDTVISCIFIPRIRGLLSKVFFINPFRAEETLEARISIKTNSQDKPYEDPDSSLMKWNDRKSDTSVSAFVEETASKALGALTFIHASEKLGLGEQLNTWQADAYVDQGKAFLCIDPCNSGPDTKSALEVLMRAKKLDSNNASILRYLGQAQNENGLYANARESLGDAITKLKSSQRKSPLEAEVDVLLGDALVGLNAPSDAAESYLKGLEIYRSLPDTEDVKPAAYLKYARALVQSNHRPTAVAVLLQGISSSPQSEELHRQALTLIRQISSEELNIAYTESGEKYCSQPDPIRNECALLAEEKAALATEGTPNWDDVRAFAEKSLQFNPPNSQIRAEAMGYAVMASLDTDLDKANQLLNEIEKLPSREFLPSVVSWLRRLRSEYWLRKKEFEKAYLAAKEAAAADPHDPAFAALMMAEVGNAWADALESQPETSKRDDLRNEAKNILTPLVNNRFTEADTLWATVNHKLNRDIDSRNQYLAILERDPQDDSALETLLQVCVDWMSDFDCSFKAAQKAAFAGFRSRSPEVQLDIIEAAMLKGENKNAAEWLTIVGEGPELAPDLKLIRDFYAVWIALEGKDHGNAQSSFDHWKNGLQQLRSKGKDQQSLNWSFAGAKTIWKQRHLPESDFYLGMIKSMEDPQADFPMFPPGL